MLDSLTKLDSISEVGHPYYVLCWMKNGYSRIGPFIQREDAARWERRSLSRRNPAISCIQMIPSNKSLRLPCFISVDLDKYATLNDVPDTPLLYGVSADETDLLVTGPFYTREQTQVWKRLKELNDKHKSFLTIDRFIPQALQRSIPVIRPEHSFPELYPV